MFDVRQRVPRFQPETLLDFGCGPGSFSLAALDAFGRNDDVDDDHHHDGDANVVDGDGSRAARGSLRATVCVDQSPAMGDVCARLFPPEHDMQLRRVVPVAATHDLVTCGYVLSEQPSQAVRDTIVERLWEACDGVLVIAEPGTPSGFEVVRAARAKLIELGALCVAPCTHEHACPMKPGFDWCHFGQRVSRSVRSRAASGQIRFAATDEMERFSYVAVVRADRAEQFGLARQQAAQPATSAVELGKQPAAAAPAVIVTPPPPPPSSSSSSSSDAETRLVRTAASAAAQRDAGDVDMDFWERFYKLQREQGGAGGAAPTPAAGARGRPRGADGADSSSDDELALATDDSEEDDGAAAAAARGSAARESALALWQADGPHRILRPVQRRQYVRARIRPARAVLVHLTDAAAARRKHAIVDLCASDGTKRRIVVTKRRNGSAAYLVARRALWGDIFAFPLEQFAHQATPGVPPGEEGAFLLPRDLKKQLRLEKVAARKAATRAKRSASK
jgi:ribosomal protein RSM22 (predicted rRNA methylase)